MFEYSDDLEVKCTKDMYDKQRRCIASTRLLYHYARALQRPGISKYKMSWVSNRRHTPKSPEQLMLRNQPAKTSRDTRQRKPKTPN